LDNFGHYVNADFKSHDETHRTSLWYISMFVVCLFANVGIVYFLTGVLVSGHEGWEVFWRSAVAGALAVGAGEAIAFSFDKELSGIGVLIGILAITITPLLIQIEGEALNAAMPMLIGGIVAILSVTWRESFLAEELIVGGLLGGIAFAGGIIGLPIVPKNVSVIVTLPFLVCVAALLAVPGTGFVIGFGIFIRSLYERLVATARYLRCGWRRLTYNWRRLVWCLDFRRPPELLPGLHNRSDLEDFHLPKLIEPYTQKVAQHTPKVVQDDPWSARAGFDFDDVLEVLRTIATGIFFFLPAWLYRLSLRSTCWFYWPLVFAQHRAVGVSARSDKLMLNELSETVIGKTSFGLAVLLLVPFIPGVEKVLATEPVKITAIELFNQFQLMADLILPVAVLTVVVFLMSNFYRHRAEERMLKATLRRVILGMLTLRWVLVWVAFLIGLMLFWADQPNAFPPQPIKDFKPLVETYYLAPLQSFSHGPSDTLAPAQ
jgi:hypothetical protein